MIVLRLPFPPSVNRYWRHPTTGPLAGRHLISEEGRAYRDAVAQRAVVHGARRQLGRLSLAVEAFPPDQRRRDLDNLLKALLDGLQHAGVVVDDAQFDALSIRRMQPVAGGMVLVRIGELFGVADQLTTKESA